MASASSRVALEGIQSSLSTNWSSSPDAWAMARLRLSETPVFSLSMQRKRLSSAHQRRMMSRLPSVLPSLTSSTSSSRQLCPRMLRRQRSRVFSAL